MEFYCETIYTIKFYYSLLSVKIQCFENAQKATYGFCCSVVKLLRRTTK